ncbi:hypothetical protein LLEC1_01088 [Akanthomyces lecanii]|uniref:Uncharacterized protein n=1 Tax=Cordyceps confragosa TaxID=2714763 RepID=A0A179I9G5_CORDF|nr:hypothetical protein LLEC1_01088 [Akanthomyces lecanii]
MADENDKFPLHTAARERRVAVAEGLLKTSPKLSQKKDDDGRCAIHWAASSNSLDIVVLLANQPSFDPDVQDESGWTPLMIAASVPESEDVIKVLLRAGADINAKSCYPLHRAAAVGSVPMCQLLLKKLSPTNPQDVEGYTPLHHAVAEGHGDAAVALLKEGADVAIKNAEGEVALELAPDKEIRTYILRAAEREGIELEGQ